nr:universal stress protein [Streptomyces canus]
MRFALREAEARGCTLDALRAWRCPAHASADHPQPAEDPAHEHEQRASALLDAVLHDASADHPGVRVRRTTVEGSARKVLLDRSAAADLVIVGARRRSGRFGVQLGRVGHTLLHPSARWPSSPSGCDGAPPAAPGGVPRHARTRAAGRTGRGVRHRRSDHRLGPRARRGLEDGFRRLPARKPAREPRSAPPLR